ncbi:hypothetical protein DERP_006183 [Dermatophagoides pteronyssinus]|uniref:Uncharacterized protein n=1 Tax=Dermatophagoides pteronyssinus TaxID=6956 RepID=A0ABQ8IXQ8_DERPT|nr:hypothetical protein DERP_006183 [Dermatophagoides pteronyssinus]
MIHSMMIISLKIDYNKFGVHPTTTTIKIWMVIDFHLATGHSAPGQFQLVDQKKKQQQQQQNNCILQ